MKFFRNIFKIIARIVLPKMIVMGIDVQKNYVALVANSRHASNEKDHIKGIEKLEAGVIIDGEVKKPEEFLEAIQKLISRIPISKLKHEPVIVLSIPPSHLFNEMEFFPKMNKDGLKEAVRLKIETSIPWNVDEAYVDWKVRKVSDPKRIGVSIFAVSKQFLDGYLNVLGEGGWRVAVCEFHLLSLASSNEELIKGVNLAILLDGDGAEFAVFNDGELITHYIMKAYGDAPTNAGPPIQSEQIVFEAKRLMAYSQTELNLKIGKTFLFNYLGLELDMERLNQGIGTNVQLGTNEKSQYTDIAKGASSRRFYYPEREINLIPEGTGGKYNENLVLRTLYLWMNTLVVFFLVLVMSFAGFAIFIRDQRASIQENVKNLRQTKNIQIDQTLSPLIEKVHNFNRLTKLATQAKDDNSQFGEMLKYIHGHAYEQGINILTIKKSKDSMESRLHATIYAPTRESVLKFKNNIEAGKDYGGVLYDSELQDKKIEKNIFKIVDNDLEEQILIKSEPTIDSESIGLATAGDSYDYISEQDGWTSILIQGEEKGWIESKHGIKEIEVVEVSGKEGEEMMGQEQEVPSSLDLLIEKVEFNLSDLAIEFDLTIDVQFIY